MTEAGNGQAAPAQIVAGNRLRVLLKQFAAFCIVPLVVQKTAQQENGALAALGHGKTQHLRLLPAEGIGMAQRSGFQRLQIESLTQQVTVAGQSAVDHGVGLIRTGGKQFFQQAHA